MWVVLVLAAWLVLGNANSFRVIGGQAATLGQFPWQVAVQIDLGGGSQELCGGSIINSKFILTAGHCMRDISTGGYQVSTERGFFFFSVLFSRALVEPGQD